MERDIGGVRDSRDGDDHRDLLHGIHGRAFRQIRGEKRRLLTELNSAGERWSKGYRITPRKAERQDSPGHERETERKIGRTGRGVGGGGEEGGIPDVGS